MSEAAAEVLPPMKQARFVTGSIMNHVVVMTLTGAVGLMAMFLVDLADLFFLSMLNQTEVTAAIGYAGTLAFANLSLSIGTGIAGAALVARELGAGRLERAREYATSALMFSLIVSGGVTLLFGLSIGWLLQLLGAQGEALRLAKLFIWTLMPGFVLISGAVCCSFILRGLGDPRRAMYVTLLSAAITAICDPIFIFGFGWESRGRRQQMSSPISRPS
jgi:Na+-driven multidrug efflux pump